jgi:hypothetical protein
MQKRVKKTNRGGKIEGSYTEKDKFALCTKMTKYSKKKN